MLTYKKLYLLMAKIAIALVLFLPLDSSAQNKNIDLLKSLSKKKVEQAPAEVSNSDILRNTDTSDTFDSSSAIYIITKNDIKQAASTSIMDALRLAPGLQVAQVGSNWWAISSRGFNGTISNKLLVMVDGRSVYTPLFSGVYWDVQDIPLETVKQIEVIRGPGATLWGANAVNGVINIITEQAVNTQGTKLSITTGNADTIFYTSKGGKLNNNAFYRTYARYTNRGEFREKGTGNNANDGWQKRSAGFRVDWDKSRKDFITFQGDIYGVEMDRTSTLPTLTAPFSSTTQDPGNLWGANLLVRWNKNFSSGSRATLQAYLDSANRSFSVIKEGRTIFDLDFQYSFKKNKTHDITWGTGYRYVVDKQPPQTTYFVYDPASVKYNMYSAFIQDKITLKPNKLYLTAGSKFELNTYTTFEYQPSLRLSYKPTPNQTIWSAVSRAVRIPTRFETNISQVIGALPPNALALGSPPGFLRWVGNSAFNSEDLTAYEIGYRIKPARDIALDASVFFNDYKDLRTFEATAPYSTEDAAIAFVTDNNGTAESYGLEISGTWNISNTWNVKGAYSFITINTHLNEGSTDIFLEPSEGETPKNQFNLRSHLKLSETWSFDQSVYYVDNLASQNVPTYTRLDLRLEWKPDDKFSLELVGQNLLDQYHQEFNSIPLLSNTEVSRAIFAKATVKF